MNAADRVIEAVTEAAELDPGYVSTHAEALQGEGMFPTEHGAVETDDAVHLLLAVLLSSGDFAGIAEVVRETALLPFAGTLNQSLINGVVQSAVLQPGDPAAEWFEDGDTFASVLAGALKDSAFANKNLDRIPSGRITIGRDGGCCFAEFGLSVRLGDTTVYTRYLFRPPGFASGPIRQSTTVGTVVLAHLASALGGEVARPTVESRAAAPVLH